MQTGSIDLAALPTFTPDQWEGGTHELRLHGTRITVQAAPGAVAAAAEDTDTVVLAATTATEVTIRLDVPLGDAAGFWHPNAGWERTLPADWSPWRSVSLVDSAPAGCLFDTAGRSVLAFAADRVVRQTAVRFGVSEEHKRFGVWLRFPLAAGESCRVRLAAPGTTLAAALRSCGTGSAPCPGARPAHARLRPDPGLLDVVRLRPGRDRRRGRARGRDRGRTGLRAALPRRRLAAAR
ncbi:hypothetical protein ACFQ0M_12250 [Kitasatospora aburaviensis]